MPNLSGVAEETFQVLLTYNYTLMLFDQNGDETTEPADARRMWSDKPNIMVTLLDNEDNSQLTLHIGKSVNVNSILGLDQQLRNTATKYNMVFRLQRYGRRIAPKDFKKLSAMTESRERIMHVVEGMYGTSRSSYLKLEHSRMIVRHGKRIDDSKLGARSRFVESILIENNAGERFLFPTRDLVPGRAMAQHVNQGGTFADQVGQQITRMAQDFADLGTASRCLITPVMDTGAVEVAESAGKVREACRGKRRKLRKTFERLYHPSTYTAESESLVASANMLAETGEVKPDETRMGEMRRLLNDHDLPDSVFECMCKAVDEANETPITEETPCLAERNPVVKEFMQWTSRFDPSKVLTEFFLSPEIAPDIDGNIEDEALMQFSSDAFLDSPEMSELLDQHDPDKPQENQLTRDEIMNVLRQYFERHLLGAEPGYAGDGDDLADEVYPEVEAALQARGYVVEAGGLQDEQDESADGLFETQALTPEDIMLPSKNQGVNLKGETQPAEVTDPDYPNAKHPPDAEYVDRLAQLAGLRSSPAAQSPMQ